MWNWTCLFERTQKPPRKCTPRTEQTVTALETFEDNILVVMDPKKSKNLPRVYDTLNSLRYNVEIIKDISDLEAVVMRQRTLTADADVMPTVLVFEYTADLDNYGGYLDVLQDNKSLRFITITIVASCDDIEPHIFQFMDVMVIFKQRNASRRKRLIRQSWERFCKKYVQFDDFLKSYTDLARNGDGMMITKGGSMSKLKLQPVVG